MSGIPAPKSFSNNIVTIAYDYSDTQRDYTCLGALISPTWVLTAAQCFVTPSRNYILHAPSGHSLAGSPHDIARVVPHPSWNSPNATFPSAFDIQLIQLASPLSVSQGLYMRLNTNVEFPPSQNRTYLRFKGFGITVPPLNTEFPLQGSPRDLTYVDMLTFPCTRNSKTINQFQNVNNADIDINSTNNINFHNDTNDNINTPTIHITSNSADTNTNDDNNKRNSELDGMLCTSSVIEITGADSEIEISCAPCYGDVGGPLYAVDKSGIVDVLVGILHLLPFASTNFSACSSPLNRESIPYTPVSPYIDWILETVESDSVTNTDIVTIKQFIYEIPLEGLSGIDLSDSISSPSTVGALKPAARVSIIVVSALFLVGGVTALCIALFIKGSRAKKRMRELGLHAEDSFVGSIKNEQENSQHERRKDGDGNRNGNLRAVGGNGVVVDDPFTGMAEARRKSVPWWIRFLRMISISPEQLKPKQTVQYQFSDEIVENSKKKVGSKSSEGGGGDEFGVRSWISTVPSFTSIGGGGRKQRPTDVDAPSWLDAAWERLFRRHEPSIAPSNTTPTGTSDIFIQFEREDDDDGVRLQENNRAVSLFDGSSSDEQQSFESVLEMNREEHGHEIERNQNEEFQRIHQQFSDRRENDGGIDGRIAEFTAGTTSAREISLPISSPFGDDVSYDVSSSSEDERDDRRSQAMNVGNVNETPVSVVSFEKTDSIQQQNKHEHETQATNNSEIHSSSVSSRGELVFPHRSHPSKSRPRTRLLHIDDDGDVSVEPAARHRQSFPVADVQNKEGEEETLIRTQDVPSPNDDINSKMESETMRNIPITTQSLTATQVNFEPEGQQQNQQNDNDVNKSTHNTNQPKNVKKDTEKQQSTISHLPTTRGTPTEMGMGSSSRFNEVIRNDGNADEITMAVSRGDDMESMISFEKAPIVSRESSMYKASSSSKSGRLNSSGRR